MYDALIILIILHKIDKKENVFFYSGEIYIEYNNNNKHKLKVR